MGRHFVFLSVYCVLFTVTYGQLTRQSQRHGTRLIDFGDGVGIQRFSVTKFTSSSSKDSDWPDPDNFQPSTGFGGLDSSFESNFPRPFESNFPRPFKPNFPRPSEPNFPRPFKPNFRRPSEPNFPRPFKPNFRRPSEPNFPRPFKPNFPRPSLDRSTGIFSDNLPPTTGLETLDELDEPFEPNFPRPFEPNFPRPFKPNFPRPFQPNFPRPFEPNFPRPFLDSSIETFPDNLQPSPELERLTAPFIIDNGGQNEKFFIDNGVNRPLAQSAWEMARRQSAGGLARPAPLKDNIDVCGFSSLRLVQGGDAVQDTEFPWLGGLFGRARDVYLCTINLVSVKHAVTAAHCFANTNAGNFGIRWGHPRASHSNAYTNLSSIAVHPGYNNTLHDVAVVALSKPVTFTLVLKPICLWPVPYAPDEGIIGTVAGFGPHYEDLTKIEIPIVTQETCKGSHAFFHNATSEFTFCAGTKNPEVGPCKGDSGAGYMQWVEDRYYLRGLVSHSLNANGNCNLEEYIIFADLSREVDWIHRMVS